MVARIRTGKSMARVLGYNEQKVASNQAELLVAINFVKEASQLSISDKVKYFKKFTSLNERTATNCLHVSLNFDPSEALAKDKLIAIASTYMTGIGFGDQPYLVYRHDDSGHPHIHIVSTNITSDGTRISMHNLGRTVSEQSRKAIEVDFKLVKAEGEQLAKYERLRPISAEAIRYGKTSTKRAINKVLDLVLQQYKFGSLPELNAVLKLYNVTADRGAEGTRMHMAGGLTFQVIDENGKKVSAPIKASAFYMKPTLQNLAVKFKENNIVKQIHAAFLRAAIDRVFSRSAAPSLELLTHALKKSRISVAYSQNKDGLLYGVTFIDHRSKCVFKGSDLGTAYSIRSILDRCQVKHTGLPNKLTGEKKGAAPFKLPADVERSSKETEAISSTAAPEVSPPFDYVPFQLKRNKKRKKRKIKNQ